jgi:hypothetical protein
MLSHPLRFIGTIGKYENLLRVAHLKHISPIKSKFKLSNIPTLTNFQPDFIPAPLGINLIEEKAQRYSLRDIPNIGKRFLYLGFKTVRELYLNDWFMCSIISLEQAIDHFKTKTSSGAAFRSKYQKKRDALNNEFYLRYLNDWHNNKNCKSSTLGEFTLKDELLPREKVINENKVRLFVSMSLAQVIGMCRFTYTMNENFKQKWRSLIDNEFLSQTNYGIDKFHRGFHFKFSKLKDDFCFGFDGKRFDTTMSSYFMLLLYGFRAQCLRLDGPEFDRFWNLTRDTIHSIIVSRNGDLVVKTQGNPSGQFNTAIDNTIYSLTILYACLLWIRKDKYRQKFQFQVYGDDMIVSSNEEFDPHIFVEKAQMFGVNLEIDCPMRKTINGISFCSHLLRIIRYKGEMIVVGHIPYTKILSALFWRKGLKEFKSRILGLYIEAFPIIFFKLEGCEKLKEVFAYLNNTYVVLPPISFLERLWFRNPFLEITAKEDMEVSKEIWESLYKLKRKDLIS